MTVYIGTSGWQYEHWRERFYPKDVPQRLWLEHYAERFATVESNAAFYRLPERKTFEAWARRTPDDFVMAVKMSRYLTHVRRLTDAHEPVERFLGRARGLGPKLGPVLLQLPPSLRVDAARLSDTLDLFPEDVRVAVEVRHESWETDEIRRILTDHGAALCLADRRGPLRPDWVTAGWGYVRFHEGRASPRPCYGPTALETWVRRIVTDWGRDADVFVYFNNDPLACALRDAVVFAEIAEENGLRPTRVSPSADVRVMR